MGRTQWDSCYLEPRWFWRKQRQNSSVFRFYFLFFIFVAHFAFRGEQKDLNLVDLSTRFLPHHFFPFPSSMQVRHSSKCQYVVAKTAVGTADREWAPEKVLRSRSSQLIYSSWKADSSNTFVLAVVSFFQWILEVDTFWKPFLPPKLQAVQRSVKHRKRCVMSELPNVPIKNVFQQMLRKRSKCIHSGLW